MSTAQERVKDCLGISDLTVLVQIKTHPEQDGKTIIDLLFDTQPDSEKAFQSRLQIIKKGAVNYDCVLIRFMVGDRVLRQALVSPLPSEEVSVQPCQIDPLLNPTWEYLEQFLAQNPSFKVVPFFVANHALHPGNSSEIWDRDSWQQFCQRLIAEGYDRWVTFSSYTSTSKGYLKQIKGAARMIVIPNGLDKSGSFIQGGLGRLIQELD